MSEYDVYRDRLRSLVDGADVRLWLKQNGYSTYDAGMQGKRPDIFSLVGEICPEYAYYPRAVAILTYAFQSRLEVSEENVNKLLAASGIRGDLLKAQKPGLYKSIRNRIREMDLKEAAACLFHSRSRTVWEMKFDDEPFVRKPLVLRDNCFYSDPFVWHKEAMKTRFPEADRNRRIDLINLYTYMNPAYKEKPFRTLLLYIAKAFVSFLDVSEAELEAMAEDCRDFHEPLVYEPLPLLQPVEVRDSVYRILTMGKSLVDPSFDILTKADRAYLNRRGISDEEIETEAYFSMPNDLRALPHVVSNLKREGVSTEDLSGIPGFYLYEKDGRPGMVIHNVNAGIGIPIRDKEGRIQAIQIRHTYPTEAKYTWFSSGNEKGKTGISCGAPIDVVYEPQERTDILLVTEGHFKAVRFAKTYGISALCVEGVGNWKKSEYGDGIVETVQSFPDVREILIGYDADSVSNPLVAKAQFALAEALEEEYPGHVYILSWKITEGKGLDDAIDTGCERFRKIEAKKYMSDFRRVFPEVLDPSSDYAQSLKHLPKPERKKIRQEQEERFAALAEREIFREAPVLSRRDDE